MRGGEKPAGVHAKQPPYPSHRIVVPVYIPTLDGYYEHALDILRLCLESLHRSTGGRANITVVSNNCCPEAIARLEEYGNAGWLDQIVLNRVNRGKVDGVTSAARGAFEDFVTISDCDVLFLPGWLEAVEGIFRSFPECGFASPAPNPRSTWYYTSATVVGGFACGELMFDKVVPDIDLDRFGCSIGWPDMFQAEHRRAQMVLKRQGVTACVGAGHFVFTLRKQSIAALPTEACLRSFTGKPEESWIDSPVDAAGFWRLSTSRTFAYHMGNVPESWMQMEFERAYNHVDQPAPDGAPIPQAGRPWTQRIPLGLRRKLAGAIRRWYPPMQSSQLVLSRLRSEDSR